MTDETEFGLTPELPAEGNSPGVGDEDSTDNGSSPLSTPPAVIERLRDAYQRGAAKTTIIAIAPGRYRDLAARYDRIDFSTRRKAMRKAIRRGDRGEEAELAIGAKLIAEACDSIMVRPEPGAEWVPMHTLIADYKDGPPIRYDNRLANVLGVELHGGESEGTICRLVFGDANVLDDHYGTLNAWTTQQLDDEDEEDEGGDRPM